jgi:hypothetical protein
VHLLKIIRAQFAFSLETQPNYLFINQNENYIFNKSCGALYATNIVTAFITINRTIQALVTSRNGFQIEFWRATNTCL